MHTWFRGCTACCLVLLLDSVASAQTNNGQISGTVRDTSGGVLPGVTVTVTNTSTNIARTEVTGPNGTYVVASLPFGAYSVSVELQGFRKAEKTGIQLPPDGRITADFSLNVGSMQVPHRIDDCRHRDVDDAFFRAEPPQLTL